MSCIRISDFQTGISSSFWLLRSLKDLNPALFDPLANTEAESERPSSKLSRSSSSAVWSTVKDLQIELLMMYHRICLKLADLGELVRLFLAIFSLKYWIWQGYLHSFYFAKINGKFLITISNSYLNGTHLKIPVIEWSKYNFLTPLLSNNSFAAEKDRLIKKPSNPKAAVPQTTAFDLLLQACCKNHVSKAVLLMQRANMISANLEPAAGGSNEAEKLLKVRRFR